MDFCPRCGKRGTHGKLCANCAGAEAAVQRGKAIVLRICTGCRKMAVRHRWVKFADADELINRALAESIPTAKQIHVVSHTLPALSGPGLKQEFTITAALDEVEYELPALVRTTLCDKCGKSGTTYYEGILQLRNARPEIVEFIRATVQAQAEKGVHINKEHAMPHGRDFEITSQRFLPILGKKLVQRFGGTMQSNASIFSRDRQTSKELYRVNVLYTAPEFTVGEVVEFGNGPMRITSMRGKIAGMNLATGKRAMARTGAEGTTLQVKQTRVVKIAPRVEVLHPFTYQATPIANRTVRKLAKGEKVKVAITDHALYLL